MFTIFCFTLFILAPQGALSLVLIQQADTFSPVTHGHYYRQRRKMLHIKEKQKDAIHACKDVNRKYAMKEDTTPNCRACLCLQDAIFYWGDICMTK